MGIDGLKQKKEDELRQILTEKKEKLCQLDFNSVSGKVKNVKERKEIKKDIARVLTILRAKF